MARSVAQIEAEILLVTTAIQDILKTGASYSRPGFTLTRANLKELTRHRLYLEREVQKMSGTGDTALADVSGASAGTDSEWGE